MRLRALGLLAAVLLVAGACGEGEATPETDQAGNAETQTLTVYSGREEEYVEGLFESFEESSGIDLDVRYGDSAELAATLVEEGDSSPADVFFSQDAGSLGAVADAGLFAELPAEVLEPVDDRFESPEGLWVGTSGRGRVAAYNSETVSAQELPDGIEGFTDPSWKGRIGFPPTNSSFQAFVAGMIATEGEEATRSFLEGLLANEPKFYEDNGATTRAIASGEIEVGFVNHYYKYEVEHEEGEEIPVENHFFTGGDPGALVNCAGVGILAGSENAEAAQTFVEFLTSEEAQSYFAEEIWEYPVIDGVEPSVDLVPLDEIESPDIDLSDLGGHLEPALNLMAEVGLL
ncbi:MAG: iron ABC transporter substrate-binding protein [Actinomycetota bacterium]